MPRAGETIENPITGETTTFVGIGVSGAVAAFCAFLLFGSRAGAAAIETLTRVGEAAEPLLDRQPAATAA